MPLLLYSQRDRGGEPFKEGTRASFAMKRTSNLPLVFARKKKAFDFKCFYFKRILLKVSFTKILLYHNLTLEDNFFVSFIVFSQLNYVKTTKKLKKMI